MKSKFETYIHGLNINELRKLVLEVATDDFRKRVEQRYDDTIFLKEKQKEFSTLESLLIDIFDDDIDLHLINNFENKVAKACQKLRPYWLINPNKITDMIYKFQENVNWAFDNNYLYEIDYRTHDEKAYEGEYFARYVAEFIAAIPTKNQEYACKNIAEIRLNSAYAVFENLEDELQKLIPNGLWQRYFY